MYIEACIKMCCCCIKKHKDKWNSLYLHCYLHDAATQHNLLHHNYCRPGFTVPHTQSSFATPPLCFGLGSSILLASSFCTFLSLVYTFALLFFSLSCLFSSCLFSSCVLLLLSVFFSSSHVCLHFLVSSR